MRLTWYEVLGVAEDAAPDVVEGRVRALREWLKQASAPRAIRPWLRDQRVLVEAAYEVYQASLEAEEEQGEGTQVRRRRWQELRSPSFSWLHTRLGQVAVGGVVGLVALGLILWLGGFLDGGNGQTTTHLTGTAGEATSGAQFLAQNQERIAQLEAAVALSPSDTESLFELGETHIVGEDWAKAIFWFERLLQVDPANVHAATDIGTANYNLGRYPEAEDAWQKALAMAPEDAQVHHNLGYLYAFSPLADYARAEAHWLEVLRLVPGSSLADTVQAYLEEMRDLARAATPTPETVPR